MNLRTTLNNHRVIIGRMGGLPPRPFDEICREYLRQYRSLARWCRRCERASEWDALTAWWRCKTPADYERVKREHGHYLVSALKKWRKTERYQTNKRRRKLGY